jgi:uncharacterized protein YtpQ (UPF0354 family)
VSDEGTFTSRAIAYLKVAIGDDPSPTPSGFGWGGVATLPDGTTRELSAENMFIMRPLVGPLVVMYAVDIGDAYALVQERHLTKDGIDRDALHRVGVSNLAQHASGRAQLHRHNNIFAVTMGGDFEASLMTLDTLWDESFRNVVKGHYAVAAPARDILAFCDASSAVGLAELRELVGRIFPDGDHLLSDRLFVRRDRTWQPLDN